MEYPTEDPPFQQKDVSVPSQINPVYLGIALAISFAIGLIVGLVGRPILLRDVPIQVVVTVVPDANNRNAVAQTSAVNSSDTITSTVPEAVSEPGSVESTMDKAVMDSSASLTPTPTLMEFVLSDARHIQGDSAAPVTIIEFSDFK